jgi:hypothetical protein
VKFFNAEGGFGSMRPTAVPTPALDREGWAAASVSVLVGCWYRDPVHRPAVGWRPTSCNGPVTHAECAVDGDELVYCEAHAYGRGTTIRLPLVRRMRVGEQPEHRR